VKEDCPTLHEHVVYTQPHGAGLCPLARLGLNALATSGLHRRLQLAILGLIKPG
jgi:hypothetical protein